ncbi:efflux RND transporter periplasmic adaptor subunit [Humitalea sp. 24SJ18S-53]|uniref:efflux RND transporter periplasmic adaptor subunit n=1 Tax=Humitalea sp. 24SJ18S-53 TaxID=3422307 RepID=UPI003D664A3E
MVRKLLILALLAAVGAGGWYGWQSLPLPVTLAPATTGLAVEAVYATGSVEPVTIARVGPATRARVTAVLVEEGQRVTEGQPMAQLDNRETRARVEEAEARARYAAEDVARVRTLVSRDIAARATLDRAESEARAARAVADAILRRLDDFVVRAPAAGVVLRRDVEVGEIVDTPATLFWIGEPSPLRVSAEVDEEDIARVSPGQKVVLRADAFPGRVLTGTVATITPRGDTTRKAYRVRLALPLDTPLLIGMTVEANIVLRETPDAVLVSPDALRDGHVFVVEDGVLRRIPVRVGVQAPRSIEIREGLSAGTMVVVEPVSGLAAGQRVRIRS